MARQISQHILQFHIHSELFRHEPWLRPDSDNTPTSINMCRLFHGCDFVIWRSPQNSKANAGDALNL